MDIWFRKLCVYYPSQGGWIEYPNYYDLPVQVPIGNNWGWAVLYFVFRDTKSIAQTSIEFIRPDGTSEGKESLSLSTDQGYSSGNAHFNMLGTFKIKGTLNGMVKTWDAVSVVRGEPEPPEPPPNAIYNILCWNPSKRIYQKDLVDVPPVTDIGVKFTTENWLNHAATLKPKAVIYNPGKTSNSGYLGDAVYRSQGEQFSFSCIKINGWPIEGLCLADLLVLEVSSTGHTTIVWAAYGVPIANIVAAPPPPGNFGLEITQYQRI